MGDSITHAREQAAHTDQANQADQNEHTSQTEVKATARPTIASLLPASNEPESAEQRMGAFRNGAYHEKVSVQRIDPQQEQARRRSMVLLGLEVALAVSLTVASRIWSWAQEERARARIDRVLRQRLGAS